MVIAFWLILLIVGGLVVFRYKRSHKLPPGPMYIPFIGNLGLLQKGGDKVLENMAQKYGDVMSAYVGPYLVVTLSGYDAIHEAFVNMSHAFSGRPGFMFISDILTDGKGILMRSGRPAFTIRHFIENSVHELGKSVLEDIILDEMEHLRVQLQTAGSHGVVSDTKKIFRSGGCNMILSLVCGSRLEYTDADMQNILASLDLIYGKKLNTSPVGLFPVLRHLPKFRKLLDETEAALETLKKYIDREIERHRDKFDENNITDFIDMCIDATQRKTEDLKDDDVFRIAVDFLIAGIQTTGCMLNWCILYMIAFPEVQSRCQDELDNVIEKGKGIRNSDIEKLPFLKATVCEILRHCGAGPTGVRRATTENFMFRGYYIPKNAIVTSRLDSALTDPKYFQNPESFRPDRFLDNDNSLRTIFAFIPFGIGSRSCLGYDIAQKQVFLILGHLLQNLRFTKADFDEILEFKREGATILNPKPYKLLIKSR